MFQCVCVSKCISAERRHQNLIFLTLIKKRENWSILTGDCGRICIKLHHHVPILGLTDVFLHLSDPFKALWTRFRTRFWTFQKLQTSGSDMLKPTAEMLRSTLTLAHPAVPQVPSPLRGGIKRRPVTQARGRRAPRWKQKVDLWLLGWRHGESEGDQPSAAGERRDSLLQEASPCRQQTSIQACVYVRVHVSKCSDCRLSTFNLLSDTLLASLIKSPLPAGGFGRATRKTLSLTHIHHVCSRPSREQNAQPPHVRLSV